MEPAPSSRSAAAGRTSAHATPTDRSTPSAGSADRPASDRGTTGRGTTASGSNVTGKAPTRGTVGGSATAPSGLSGGSSDTDHLQPTGTTPVPLPNERPSNVVPFKTNDGSRFGRQQHLIEVDSPSEPSEPRPFGVRPDSPFGHPPDEDENEASGLQHKPNIRPDFSSIPSFSPALGLQDQPLVEETYDPREWEDSYIGIQGQEPPYSIWAIVAIICCMNILGVVFGFIAKSKISQTGERGWNLAHYATIIGAICTGLTVVGLLLYVLVLR
ncbi:uncharacterized protein DUF4190 [Klugiella xanthotipulae]|uniref:Uncharacterized protein DUF4190 n=1 Tax=Klugiella xanthotipulae TaxID=244735 RepID=A0A543I563_9MICO|nr:uncharacterized protein DUF4190 [Klugiella xanthotipulae]